MYQNEQLTAAISNVRKSTGVTCFQVALTPGGHPALLATTDPADNLSKKTAEQLSAFFSQGYATGLLHLSVAIQDKTLPISIKFWRQFSRLFITSLCYMTGGSTVMLAAVQPPVFPMIEMENLLATAPFMAGSEYLNADVLQSLWEDLWQALLATLQKSALDFTAWLTQYDSTWKQVGRICFHLAENKRDPNAPFAFLATYVTHLSQQGTLSYVPLGRALQEYTQDQRQLLALLLPIQKAGQSNEFLKQLIDTGSIFKPLAWRAKEAYQLLQAIPLLEEAGIVVKTPDWWKATHAAHPKVAVTMGKKETSHLGLDALLDFQINLCLPNGMLLQDDEIASILSAGTGLIQLKGQWVAVDHEKLGEVLSHWKKIARQVEKEGLSFADALRMTAGLTPLQNGAPLPIDIATWSQTIAGDWLQEVLTRLRQPEQALEKTLPALLKKHFCASLRPYQVVGVQWLWTLYQMKLGACLADDMGLGKTIQVLALLTLIRHHPLTQSKVKHPHLLVLPASLLGNWQMEFQKFAPGLRLKMIHASMTDSPILLDTAPDLSGIDLVITTYTYASKLNWLKEINWDLLVLDEAQAIKNPAAKQSQAIKALKSQRRLVLTGTPIENRLMDLWSLFDFVAPGLLGSNRAFAKYGKNTEEAGAFNAALRRLISPYILRRLKSDKRIIADLPDKTELQTYCNLSKTQSVLYQQAVLQLTRELETVDDDMKRRGLVLAYLSRFKQICNHPNQWSGQGAFNPQDSGKFLRLGELCEEIAARQEKVLIFTQFREIIPALEQYLFSVFGQAGLTLDGSTPIKERTKRVNAFQQECGPPFFILSLKAGGTGLTLTHASHVIHFDRWWNPAVENQATDRAYRIGQKKNVLVHKFVCLGTIEEKIDDMLRAKQSLASDIIGEPAVAMLTEMSDNDLLAMVSLDIHSVLTEKET
ncbi:MAG: DEAD/DEAH box helicase [Legionellales bacterium]|nr:DEAD/DEAH box helicase [Legionellales bacterium]